MRSPFKKKAVCQTERNEPKEKMVYIGDQAFLSKFHLCVFAIDHVTSNVIAGNAI